MVFHSVVRPMLCETEVQADCCWVRACTLSEGKRATVINLYLEKVLYEFFGYRYTKAGTCLSMQGYGAHSARLTPTDNNLPSLSTPNYNTSLSNELWLID